MGIFMDSTTRKNFRKIKSDTKLILGNKRAVLKGLYQDRPKLKGKFIRTYNPKPRGFGFSRGARRYFGGGKRYKSLLD